MMIPRAVRTQSQSLKRKVGYEGEEEQATRDKLRRMQIDSEADINTPLANLD